ncbi:MAG TPA: sulfatase-like hydrolase/transferase [Thermoanaerobaculia bacterium]|nr:sulfatase-like hydrolase/transferase [Thermoanaerobaculia bacterium]
MKTRSSRREFLKQAGAVAVAGAVPALGQTGGEAVRRPNVLFLFPDQHRPDWIEGTAGVPVPTPNLRRLQELGVTFERTLCASPVCAPSRACLASGREYERCGVRGPGNNYPRQQTTVFRRLRDGGYHTMACGKLDLATGEIVLGVDGRRFIDEYGFSDGIDSPGKGRGFRAYFQPPVGPKDAYYSYLHEQSPELARRCAEDYVRREGMTLEQAAESNPRDQGREERGAGESDQKRDRQFRDTDPSPVPDEHYCDNWIAQTGLDLLERAPREKPWLLWVNFAGPHPPMDITAAMERRYRGPDRTIDGFAPPHAYRGSIDSQHHLRIRQNYAAMIENIDRWVGTYLETLERRGELENTIVVYASDHGEMLGDHGRWGKSVPYQSSAGVPLIVAGPGVRRGHRSQALVSLMDLSATFLDYGGQAVPGDMDSRSLRPVMEGASEHHREWVRSGLRDWRLVWDGRYKYVTGFAGEAEQLFDLEADPWEDRNILAAAPAEALRLREILRAETQRAAAG